MPEQNNDQGADFVFASRSAGNSPEKIAEALEKEGIFVTSTSEMNDGGEVVTTPAEKPVDPPAESEKPAADKTEEPGAPGDTAATAAGDKDKPQGNDTGHKLGVKERLRAKNAELASKVDETAAELKREREQREQIARELEEWKSGKRDPASDFSGTKATTVEKTEEKPAESQPRPKRPKEADFWESDDPAAALEAAQDKYEDDLILWRTTEATREKQVAEQTARREREAQTFESLNVAEQQARVSRWNAQVDEAKQVHPDFEEALRSAPAFTPVMIEAAHASDYTAEIGYYLAKNPEVADRIRESTQLPPNATQGQINKAMRKANEEYIKIEAILAEAEDREDAQVTDKPVAATPPPAAAAPVVPVKKFTPVTPVGGRGGKSQKTMEELSRSQNPDDLAKLRNMSLDEIRRRQKAG